MRVLNFLIGSKSDIITRNLVDYLIDAGHFVYVYQFNIDEDIKWEKKYKHNLEIIDKNSSLMRNFDYVIDFDDTINEIGNLLKINFLLSLENNKLSVLTLLEHQQRVAIICRRAGYLGNLCDSSHNNNIIFFYKEITEVFIDTIVHLLRHGEESLEFRKKPAMINLFSKIRDYEYSSKKLNTYYQELKNNDKLFLLNHFPVTNDDCSEYGTYSLILNRIHFHPTDLEMLALYILTLLNAGQEGIYGYNFLFSQSQKLNLERMLVSKFIPIKILDSYQDLIEKFNDDLYKVVESPFHREEILKNSPLKPKILVTYEENYQDNSYLLHIGYKAQAKEIFIKYRKDLPYFQDIDQYLNDFFNKLDIFASGDINFSEVLELPQNYINKVIAGWNQTEKKYPHDKTIQELFEEQAKKTPDNVAVVFEGQQLTYQELNTRANQLAHYLREKGVKPDTLVVIACERSLEMLIGIMGILKAGGAYVPIDPFYPPERIQFILEDTRTSLFLTQQDIIEKLPNTTPEVVLLDKNREKFTKYPTSNPSPIAHSHHLAYVIYTSGSTGKPKGVMVEHKSLVHSTMARFSHYEEQPSSFLMVSPFSFDSSVAGIFWTLTQGGSLVLPRSSVLEPSDIEKLISQHNVAYILCIPSFYAALQDFLVDKDLGLVGVIVAGEACTDYIIDKHRQHFPTVSLFNEYGPTEATVWASASVLYDKNSQEKKKATIGRPIPNTQMYILNLNDRKAPVPIGVTGELYIGGVGLARGYLNKPELTLERFIENPFQTEEEKTQGRNGNLYKTGDLARWLPDGNIEYIGRNDFQVKIRGYRIELGEIENALSSFAGIKQSAVLIRERKDPLGNTAGDKYLVGYYVADNKLSEHEIRLYLQTKLPEYTIPSVFVCLDKFPLTASGKLNREALPTPEYQEDNKDYLAPRTKAEQDLCEIWQDVLKTEKVGIRDDFFKLGGDSITSIRLVNKIKKKLGANIEIKDIFKYRNIEKFCENMLAKNQNTC